MGAGSPVQATWLGGWGVFHKDWWGTVKHNQAPGATPSTAPRPARSPLPQAGSVGTKKCIIG